MYISMADGDKINSLFTLVYFFLQVALCTEGTSLLPLVESATSSVKSYSFSQYSRPDPPGSPQENIEVMGYSIRGPRYR